MTEGSNGAPPAPAIPPVPYWENPAWQQAGWVDPSAMPAPAAQASAPAPVWPAQSAWSPQPAWQPPSAWSTPSRGPRYGLRTALIIVAVVLLGGATTAVQNARHHSPTNAVSLPAQPVVTLPLPIASSPPTRAPSSPAPLASAAAAGPVAGGATAHSAITSASGTQVFADGFTDASSGWRTGTEDGVTYGYTTGGYEIVPTAEYTYVSYAPYEKPISQLSMTLTASEQAGAGVDAGFGADCVRDIGGSTELRYQFLVDGSGRWWVQRYDGAPNESAYPQNLRTGSSPATPGVTPITATAVCATLADGTTTRLLFFVNGKQVADLLDTSEAGNAGWLGAILSTGDDETPTTIDVRSFSESDLGAPTAATMPSEPDSNT